MSAFSNNSASSALPGNTYLMPGQLTHSSQQQVRQQLQQQPAMAKSASISLPASFASAVTWGGRHVLPIASNLPASSQHALMSSFPLAHDAMPPSPGRPSSSEVLSGLSSLYLPLFGAGASGVPSTAHLMNAQRPSTPTIPPPPSTAEASSGSGGTTAAAIAQATALLRQYQARLPTPASAASATSGASTASCHHEAVATHQNVTTTIQPAPALPVTGCTSNGAERGWLGNATSHSNPTGGGDDERGGEEEEDEDEEEEREHLKVSAWPRCAGFGLFGLGC
jgi:hypothetical protein